MENFSRIEMMLMSDGLLKLIGDANEAVKLVDDPATHKAIEAYRNRLVALNSKLCSVISEMENSQQMV